MAQQNINVNMTGNSSGLVSAVNAGGNALKGLTNVAVSTAKALGTITVAGAKLSGTFAKWGASLPVNALSSVGNGIKNLTGFLVNNNRALGQSSTYFKGLIGQVVNLSSSLIGGLGSALRQVGQGLQNFGTTFTIYVSAPVAAFIYSMTQGFIDFQDRMIEVRRTTGLTMDQVGDLQRQIQNISLTTPTSPEDLASMAAEWGKLGVSVPEDIAKLTESSDKLKVATDLTTEQVVNDLGKIGAIYFKSSTELAKNYDRVASAINELGQASPVSEADIISAFQRVAPAGKLLNIPIDQLLGLSTAVAERAASPERAGTQLSRALVQQATNLDDFSKALGKSTDEVKAMIDANPIEFFLNMADAINNLASNTDKIRLAEELFGGVGGKAIESLAANLPGLYEKLKLANDAYEDGTSIQKEYLRSTDSVKVQLGILQNNFRFLGFSIAEQVIPYITKFAEIAIPAVKSVSNAFGALSEQTKILIIGLGVLVAVLGPLTIFFGSLFFSLGIITTGLVSAWNQVVGLATGFVSLVFTILSLFNPIELLVIAITGIGAAFLYVTDQATAAGALLSSYVGKFAEWGYNLFAGFAQGIQGAASLVRDVVLGVINGFIGLIQAFSPPKEGPLRGIRDWGFGIGATYAEGIEEAAPLSGVAFLKVGGYISDQVKALQNAIAPKAIETGESITKGVATGAKTNMPAVQRVLDALKKSVDDADEYIITIGAKFSESFAKGLQSLDADSIDLFSSIFGKIRSAVEAIGENLGLDGNEIDKRILSTADAVQKLIQSFQNTGNIGSLKSIYDLLGGMGDEADDLIKSQLEYNAATEDLDRIKKQMDGVDDALRKEIESISARKDLTLDEKSALIRNARFRASANKDSLKDEEKTAQDRVDVLKDEAQRRQQILDTLVSLVSPADKEKKKKDKKEDDLSGSLAGFNPDAFAEGMKNANDTTQKLFADTTEKLGGFFTAIDKAGRVWKGFIAGLTGNMPGVAELSTLGADFWAGFTPGDNIRQAWLTFKDGLDQFGGSLDGIKAGIKDILDLLGAGTLAGYLGFNKDDLSNLNTFETIVYNIGYYLGIATEKAEKLFGIWTKFGGVVMGKMGIGEAKEKADKAPDGSKTATLLENINWTSIGALLADSFNKTFEIVFGEGFKLDEKAVRAFVKGILDSITAFFIVFDFSGVTDIALALINGIISGFADFSLESANIGNYAYGLTGFVTHLVQGIIDFMGKIKIETLGVGLSGFVAAILEGVGNVDLKPMQKFLNGLINGIIDIFSIEWNGESNLERLGGIITKLLNMIIDILADKSTQENLGTALANLVDAVVEVVDGLDWSKIDSIVFEGLTTTVTSALLAIDWSGLFHSLFTTVNQILWGIITAPWQNGKTDGITPITPNDNPNDVTEHGFPTDLKPTEGDNIWKTLWKNIMGDLWQPTPSAPNPNKMPSSQSGNGQPAGSSPWPEGGQTDFPPVGGGQSTVPLVLSPSVRDEALKTGKDWQDLILQGFEQNFVSPDAINRVGGALQSLTSSTTMSSYADINGFGNQLGETTMMGFVDRISGDTATQELDTHWVGSLQGWVKSRDASIQDIGDSAGTKVIKGLGLQLTNTDSYLPQWATGVARWVDTPSNSKSFADTGVNVGGEILGGVLKSINKGGEELARVLASIIPGGTPMTEQEIDDAIFKLLHPETPTVPATVNVGSLPGFVDNSKSDVVQFNISIEGGTPQDKESMRRMVQMLYDQMRKEGALKGAVR